MKPFGLGIALLSAALLAGCVQPDPDWANKAALQIGAPRADAAGVRARQTKIFQGVTEPALLAEATQVLQDLGFTIEESVSRLGVLAGSKDRDAVEVGEVVGQVALSVLAALAGVQYQAVYDTDQVIRATLTTRPVGAKDAALRVSFERIVTTNQGLSRVEELSEAEFSSGFFAKVRSGLGAKG